MSMFINPLNAMASQPAVTSSQLYTPAATPLVFPGVAESPDVSTTPTLPLLTSSASPSAVLPANDWQVEGDYTPPIANNEGGMPPTLPPRQSGGFRQRRWAATLIALALLVVLTIGVGLGALLTSGKTSTTSTVVIGATSAPRISTSSSTLSLQQTLENVAAAVEPSVVKITSVSNQQEAIGSGDILTANGYIVTNDHVVQGYTSFTVTLTNGSKYTAQVVGQDAQDDLAVLKIAATNLQPIAFADSSKATVGEFSVAIGYPLGLQETATSGIVSALNRAVSEAPSGPAGELVGLIQTSAQLNPGNSGGALVNLQGQIIGIPTLGVTNPETGQQASAIGYAIPSDRVEYVAEQLIQYGKLTNSKQGFLGIQGEDITAQVASANNLTASSGVLVTGFTTDTANQSPAQLAGVQSGDVITAVNGQSISSSDDLASIVLNQAPGTKVTLTIIRGSSQLTLTVTLGERPVS